MSSHRLIARIWSAFNWLTARLCAMIILFIMLTVCYEVVVRYFLQSPTSWSVEVNSYLLVYLVFLMAGVIQGENGHVQVEALRLKLSPKPRSVLSIFNGIVSLASMLILVWLSWVLSWEALKANARFPDMMQTPQFPVLVAVPFGLLIVSLHLGIQIYAQILNLLGKTAKLRPGASGQTGRDRQDVIA